MSYRDDLEDNSAVVDCIAWLKTKNLCNIEDSPYMYCSAEGGYMGPKYDTQGEIEEYLADKPDCEATDELRQLLNWWAQEVPELGLIDVRDADDEVTVDTRQTEVKKVEAEHKDCDPDAVVVWDNVSPLIGEAYTQKIEECRRILVAKLEETSLLGWSFYCKHDQGTRLTIKKNKANIEEYRPQCLLCGRTFGAAVAKASVSYIPPVFDTELEAQRNTLRNDWLRRIQRAQARVVPTMTREEYMQSPAWKAIRLKVLARDKYLCQGCLTAGATQVHHTTYANLYDELLFQLQSLCDHCHKKVHHKL